MEGISLSSIHERLQYFTSHPDAKTIFLIFLVDELVVHRENSLGL